VTGVKRLLLDAEGCLDVFPEVAVVHVQRLGDGYVFAPVFVKRATAQQLVDRVIVELKTRLAVDEFGGDEKNVFHVIHLLKHLPEHDCDEQND